MNTLFKNFRLLSMRDNGVAYGALEQTAILVRNGIIDWLGAADELTELDGDDEVIDGQGNYLSPGLIDCHTHLVYGGNRANEWEMRLNGVPYEEIAKQGGGILSTVRATREASEGELFETVQRRLRYLARQGVTTFEIKTGYGLDLETELKMLRVINRLRDELPFLISRTLLAAHAIPPEFRDDSDAYIDLVCDQIIPAAASSCDAVDVFCETIAFDLEQTRRVFEAAQNIDARLGLKIHAEQLSHLGGASLAAALNAWSADHLEYLNRDDCRNLADSGTVATLLPGAFYNLKERQQPAIAALREFGVDIAIATDANPGSSPVSSILLMAHMACTLFGLTPVEAILGLTRNAAKALRLDSQIGTLEVGKRADFAIWDIESPSELAYGIGHNPCTEVFVSGRKV